MKKYVILALAIYTTLLSSCATNNVAKSDTIVTTAPPAVTTAPETTSLIESTLSTNNQQLLLEQGVNFDGYNQDYHSVDAALMTFVGADKAVKFLEEGDNFNIVAFVKHFDVSKEDFKRLVTTTSNIDEMVAAIYSDDANAVGVFFNQDTSALLAQGKNYEKPKEYYNVKGCLIRHVNAKNPDAFYDFVGDTSPEAFNIEKFMEAYKMSKADVDAVLIKGECEGYYDKVL